MNRLGPTFYDELRAAGATTEMMWQPETGEITYLPSVTAEERAVVEAVLSAHDPVASQATHERNLANEKTKAALRDIDIASIRSIREYIAALADAPQKLRDHEAAVVVERGKLR